jgi:hypothetical protein
LVSLHRQYVPYSNFSFFQIIPTTKPNPAAA